MHANYAILRSKSTDVPVPSPLSNFESNANGRSTWTYYIRFVVVVVLDEEYLFNQSNQHIERLISGRRGG